MTKTTFPTPTTSSLAPTLHIPLPDTLKDEYLRDVIIVYNAMIAHRDLQDAFPDDLEPHQLHAEILEHYKLVQTRGQARTEVSDAVEVRAGAIKRGKAVYDRVLSLINASSPLGTPGRVAYFPKDDTNPHLGDLLIAAGRETAARGKPKLPEGWTGASLQELGAEVSAALTRRSTSGKRREGVGKAYQVAEKRIAEIRRRLRGFVTGFLGNSHPRLVEFGIQPRPPATGRRRKPAATPATGSEPKLAS